ncbi:Fc.00g059900.m01.CDS01 [Cosmosporella sp. VM-42]
MYSIIIPVATVAFLLVYFVLCPIYNYFRDPKGLRKYPSVNVLAGITDIGFMYEAVKGFRSKKLSELHQKHPVIRIGPNSLSFTGAQAIKDIYGHGTQCTKDLFYATLAGTHFHLADVLDKREHARKRKVLSSAYALKNLEEWEYKVADKTERFIKACDAACTAPLAADRPDPTELTFDYRKYTNFFTIDAIADIGLSEHLGFLDSGTDECVGERTDGMLHNVNFRAALHNMAIAQACIVWAYPWYNFNIFLAKLISSEFRRLWRFNDDWNDIVYHRAQKRLRRYQAGEKLDDFFQALMENKSGQQNHPELGEVVAEVSIMMNAGSDTTALAMVNAMYNLLRHPVAMQRLRQEIDTVMDPNETVAPYDKVKHLPYLRAVLDESLRLTPPSSFGLPRRTPPGGWNVSSEYIAGDTSVSISAYVAHRDETIFPDAESFIPERWLGEKGRELQTGFVAFSAGARGCIGRNISYLEQTVLLASVVHRYEMALPSDTWVPERREAMNLMMEDMPVKVWRR